MWPERLNSLRRNHCCSVNKTFGPDSAEKTEENGRARRPHQVCHFRSDLNFAGNKPKGCKLKVIP